MLKNFLKNIPKRYSDLPGEPTTPPPPPRVVQKTVKLWQDDDDEDTYEFSHNCNIRGVHGDPVTYIYVGNGLPLPDKVKCRCCNNILTVVSCISCNETSVCSYCKGTGKPLGEDVHPSLVCGSCRGSGKCSYCNEDKSV